MPKQELGISEDVDRFGSRLLKMTKTAPIRTSKIPGVAPTMENFAVVDKMFPGRSASASVDAEILPGTLLSTNIEPRNIAVDPEKVEAKRIAACPLMLASVIPAKLLQMICCLVQSVHDDKTLNIVEDGFTNDAQNM